MISDSIRKQSIQIFQNIEFLFDDISDELFTKKIGGFQLWKQMYHLLHSLDKNFIDPVGFIEPAIHKKNLDIIYMESEERLDRAELLKYFSEIKRKIEGYLNSLDDKILEETVNFKGMRLTKMESILAQFRHIFFHIGYFHCCIKIEEGRTPEYVGLYTAVPEK